MYDATGKKSQNRDDLIIDHIVLVKKIAYHMVATLPASVQVDDLIQAGMLGLMDAATQYDATQGAAFATYASIRVRGAMLDELRRNDWVPKSVHRRSRDLADAIHRVEIRTGRDASDREVAEEMGISLDEYHTSLHNTTTCRMSSFDELHSGDDDRSVQFADGQPIPTEILLESEFKQGLADAIAGLPERERLIISLYYDEELNLKEIGQVLEVSESRISQLLKQAHGRLQSRMRAYTS